MVSDHKYYHLVPSGLAIFAVDLLLCHIISPCVNINVSFSCLEVCVHSGQALLPISVPAK